MDELFRDQLLRANRERVVMNTSSLSFVEKEPL
jgi:hypothetical protein